MFLHVQTTLGENVCPLTPVELEGHTNITSVLINGRVGLDLRVWWADDLRLGWPDNSYKASRCRANSWHYVMRRDTTRLGSGSASGTSFPVSYRHVIQSNDYGGAP